MQAGCLSHSEGSMWKEMGCDLFPSITFSLVPFLHTLFQLLFGQVIVLNMEYRVLVLSFALRATLLFYSTPVHKTPSLQWGQKAKMRHRQSFPSRSL